MSVHWQLANIRFSWDLTSSKVFCIAFELSTGVTDLFDKANDFNPFGFRITRQTNDAFVNLLFSFSLSVDLKFQHFLMNSSQIRIESSFTIIMMFKLFNEMLIWFMFHVQLKTKQNSKSATLWHKLLTTTTTLLPWHANKVHIFNEIICVYLTYDNSAANRLNNRYNNNNNSKQLTHQPKCKQNHVYKSEISQVNAIKISRSQEPSSHILPINIYFSGFKWCLISRVVQVKKKHST